MEPLKREKGAWPISITIQVGDWFAEHHQMMSVEQYANMREGVFSDVVKRMFDELFDAFRRRYRTSGINISNPEPMTPEQVEQVKELIRKFAKHVRP